MKLDDQPIRRGNSCAEKVERGARDARSDAGQGGPSGRVLLQHRHLGLRPLGQVATSPRPAFGDGARRLEGAAGPIQLQRRHQCGGQGWTVSGKRFNWLVALWRYAVPSGDGKMQPRRWT